MTTFFKLLFVIFCWYTNSSIAFVSSALKHKFHSMSVLNQTTKKEVKLPEKLIVGYANWNQCDELLVKAVQQGVNVLIWFAINLTVDPVTGKPTINNGPERTCVEKIINEIKSLNLSTVHLISVGGWNAPHPDTSIPVEDMYKHWKEWNNNLFDGFDWDIEGNDDFSSRYNHFTYECLDFMGRFSQLAKQDGYLVAMAPAESYLDPSTSAFDSDLIHTYPEWQNLEPKGAYTDFRYHGHNVYAYLLIKYKDTVLTSNDTTTTTTTTTVDTFDFITIQLYEGYSHAQYQIFIQKVSPIIYLENFIKQMNNGWEIELPTITSITTTENNLNNKDTCNNPTTTQTSSSSSSSLPAAQACSIQRIKINVPKSKLVIGLANGWAGDGKFLFIDPDDIATAYTTLVTQNTEPRGFAFWNIKDEGLVPSQQQREENKGQPVWLASSLNKFLKIRNSII